MTRETRFAGAAREAERPLTVALYEHGGSSLATTDTILTYPLCCDATNLLAVYLKGQGFKPHIRWGKIPPAPEQSGIVVPSFQNKHVLLHHEEEGADPTYTQFLVLAGSKQNGVYDPELSTELAHLLPERKLGVFRLADAALFGNEVAEYAVAIRRQMRGLDGDVPAMKSAHDIEERGMREFYSQIWNPKAYRKWSFGRQAARLGLDKAEIVARYQAIVDTMK